MKIRQKKNEIDISMGAVILDEKTIQFTVLDEGKKNSGILLYPGKNKEAVKIPWEEKYRVGNVFACVVEDVSVKDLSYNFYEDDRIITDKYAKKILGNEIWGVKTSLSLCGSTYLPEFDWEGDTPLRSNLEDMVMYQLHVRGFTKHSSSGVKKKGTFEGIMEKIPYLKELGVNALELMPCYEFLEYEKPSMSYASMEEATAHLAMPTKEEDVKLNYWGFKKGYYFAPKASYSGSKDATISFRNMVKALHQAGMEVILQFYFDAAIKPGFMLEVLKYWVSAYHVDGFRLMGGNIPAHFLATCEELVNTKLFFQNLSEYEIYSGKEVRPYPHVCTYKEDYLFTIRHFLKGDAGSLQNAFMKMREKGKLTGNVCFVTNYNTFTLQDLVTYDRKHNSINGENNTDGNPYNASWNCGVEGTTRKKQINALREKQKRNALMLVLFSAGIPVLMAGDEFGNSQEGNNNPYCQDNPISWLNWKNLEKNKDFFEEVKNMISLSKEISLIKQTGTDKGAGEFPFLSFHGAEAWKLNMQNNDEAGAMLFTGDKSYYLAFNMHWEKKELALPKLGEKNQWKQLYCTEKAYQPDVSERVLELPARTVLLLQVVN